jgi:hypothetical protein
MVDVRRELRERYRYQITATSSDTRYCFTDEYEVLPSGVVSATSAVVLRYSPVDGVKFFVSPVRERVLLRHREIEIECLRLDRKSE